MDALGQHDITILDIMAAPVCELGLRRASPAHYLRSPALIAAAVGVWLFFVQHQFDQAHWVCDERWSASQAALGSSYYALPAPLSWSTANLGVDHVHQLFSRIPYYRLPEVLRDYPSL